MDPMSIIGTKYFQTDSVLPENRTKKHDAGSVVKLVIVTRRPHAIMFNVSPYVHHCLGNRRH